MLDNPVLAGAVLGGLGGLIRAIVGVWKSRNRGRPFKAGYFFVTVAVAVLIGIGLGISLDGTAYMKLTAFLGGYGGTDFLEGLGHATKILKEK